MFQKMLNRVIVTSLIIVWSFVIFQDLISTPSCRIVARTTSSTSGDADLTVDADSSDDLKVMMVANLLLLGSESSFVDRYFTEYYMAKFFKVSQMQFNSYLLNSPKSNSFERLMPDMLIVLGDVSAKGYGMGKSGWNALLRQFEKVIGPFLELPFHVVLGDRDIGECNRLDKESVDWVASRFTGLDSAGSGGFNIGNISFLSLNAVALLCSNNDIRFSTEKRIERERSDIWFENEGGEDVEDESRFCDKAEYDSKWRGNKMSSGSGPVLLLHFPMHGTAESCVKRSDLVGTTGTIEQMLKTLVGRDIAGTGPYDSSHHLPANVTEYIFQALKPRIIFSAHRNDFCLHTHLDGTLEITVPALSWNARDDPGFILATFKKNRATITISQCFLAKESHILAAICSSLLLFSTLALFTKKTFEAAVM